MTQTPPLRKIAIVGASGSGKSTLAAALESKLAIPHTDLDSIHWLPNWESRPREELRARIDVITQRDRWVTSGNYSSLRDIIWARADTLIWLDYPLWMVMSRLLRRTIIRVITQQELWGTGNRENWRNLFSRDKQENILRWALYSHPKHRREYPELLKQPEFAHLTVIHFTHPRDTARWLKTLP